MTDDPDRLAQLTSQFPRIFEHSKIHWGLEYGEGWDELIGTLCARLGTILAETPAGIIELRQIKEKFGGLRFYYELRNVDKLHAAQIAVATQQAEQASFGICEACGKPGTRRDTGWICTLCDRCAAD